MNILEVDVVVHEVEALLPGLPDDLVQNADILGIAVVAAVRGEHLCVVDEVVVLPVVLPEGEEARKIKKLDDVVVQLHGERLLELCLADAEPRLLPGLADGGLDAGLRIEAGDEARGR